MDGNASDTTAGNSDFGDTTDYGGTVNGGSFVSSPIRDPITGTTGDAYKFDGNEFIEYPFSDPPAISTITFWVFLDTKSDDFAYFSNFDSTGSDTSGTYNDNSDEIQLRFDNGGDVASGIPPQSTWIHVAVTTSPGLEMYIDGNTTPVATDATGITGSIDNGSNYQTGQTPNGIFDGDGRVDDLRLYNTVLTPTEINQIYQNTEPL
jgi:hypothetical protein